MRTSDGATIDADFVAGDRDGRLPIVLLHGLSQQRSFWGPVVDCLPDRPIITVDLRGHGASDVQLDSDFTIARCAQDVLEYLDHMSIPQVVLGGHSWGASVALHLAATHPDRVARLVLIDGAIVVPSQLGPRDEVRQALTPPHIAAPSIESILDRIRSGPLGSTWSPAVESALRPTFAQQSDGTWSTRIGWQRHMRVLDDFLAYDPSHDWAVLRVPTVLICCEADARWEPTRARNIAELPDDCPVDVAYWPGAIHDVPLQSPAEVANVFDTVWRSAQEGAR